MTTEETEAKAMEVDAQDTTTTVKEDPSAATTATPEETVPSSVAEIAVAGLDAAVDVTAVDTDADADAENPDPSGMKVEAKDIEPLQVSL